MTKTEYAQYLGSEHWQQRRKMAISDADHKCERCELPRWVARLVYDQDLHVHHRNYQNVGKEGPEDLEALCRRCHEIETFGRSDYGEIKTTVCEVCSEGHFDIYSNKCSRCRVLFPARDEPDLIENFQLRDQNQLNYWGFLVEQVMQRRAVHANVLELLELVSEINQSLPALIEKFGEWAYDVGRGHAR